MRARPVPTFPVHISEACHMIWSLSVLIKDMADVRLDVLRTDRIQPRKKLSRDAGGPRLHHFISGEPGPRNLLDVSYREEYPHQPASIHALLHALPQRILHDLAIKISEASCDLTGWKET